jgi:hypothetical protein
LEPTSMTPMRISTHPRSAIGEHGKHEVTKLRRSGSGAAT